MRVVVLLINTTEAPHINVSWPLFLSAFRVLEAFISFRHTLYLPSCPQVRKYIKLIFDVQNLAVCCPTGSLVHHPTQIS